MAQLPKCPNWKEKRCAKSDMVLVSEDDKVHRFWCRTCNLMWMVSRPKHSSYARELNRVKKLQELSEAERGKVTRFISPAGGWR